MKQKFLIKFKNAYTVDYPIRLVDYPIRLCFLQQL